MLFGALTITAHAQTGPETLQAIRAKQREFLQGVEQANRLSNAEMDRAFPGGFKFCQKDGLMGLWVPQTFDDAAVMVTRNNLEMNQQLGFEDTIPKEIFVGTLKFGTFLPLPAKHAGAAPGSLYVLTIKLKDGEKTVVISRTLPTPPATLPQWGTLK